MLPFDLKLNQKWLVSWGGLRGAAAIAFAIMVGKSVQIKFCGYLPHCFWSLFNFITHTRLLYEVGNRETTYD